MLWLRFHIKICLNNLIIWRLKILKNCDIRCNNQLLYQNVILTTLTIQVIKGPTRAVFWFLWILNFHFCPHPKSYISQKYEDGHWLKLYSIITGPFYNNKLSAGCYGNRHSYLEFWTSTYTSKQGKTDS